MNASTTASHDECISTSMCEPHIPKNFFNYLTEKKPSSLQEFIHLFVSEQMINAFPISQKLWIELNLIANWMLLGIYDGSNWTTSGEPMIEHHLNTFQSHWIIWFAYVWWWWCPRWNSIPDQNFYILQSTDKIEQIRSLHKLSAMKKR